MNTNSKISNISIFNTSINFSALHGFLGIIAGLANGSSKIENIMAVNTLITHTATDDSQLRPDISLGGFLGKMTKQSSCDNIIAINCTLHSPFTTRMTTTYNIAWASGSMTDNSSINNIFVSNGTIDILGAYTDSNIAFVTGYINNIGVKIKNLAVVDSITTINSEDNVKLCVGGTAKSIKTAPNTWADPCANYGINLHLDSNC